MRIAAFLRAVARHRYGRPAAVAVALYLTGAAVTAWYDGGRWFVAVATAGVRPGDGEARLLPAAICVLNAWALWQILRGPVRAGAGALPRDVVWLRRLLYADVAGDLLLWDLLDRLSGLAEYVARWAVWAATMLLLVRVLTGVTARFRMIALGLGLAGVLGAALRPFTEIPLLSLSVPLVLATLACKAMIIAGQGRDGRFGAVTLAVGWTALLVPQAYSLLQAGRLTFDGLSLVVQALDGLLVVWAARTAHELAVPRQDAPVAGAGQAPRLLAAAAVLLVLPMAVVGAERDARLTYTAADEGCRDRLRPATGLGPEERRRSFLCLARSDTFAAGTMFPGRLPDQRVLAYGGQLCALPGDQERLALHGRAGGMGDAIELAAALEYLCPGIVARQTADADRRQAEHDLQEARWKAEANARCTDPWPRVRARRQGTAAYMLFEGGGYAVFDDRDDSAGDPGDIFDGGEEAADIFDAVQDGFIDAAGSGAAIVTAEENAPMCLTVKAFDRAPPLRLAGWDRVVEVGIASRSGRLVVPAYPEGGDSGAAGPLPSLAVAGPGRYRLRVHARTVPWDEDDPDAPLEEHLIVVYPGRSTEKVVHRPRG
ncbi:hypothetical protein [Nonomuraea sp. NPDC049624]|uniref:hypothetical protein n=2 Tax=unclassified Nonomuraea TaxID=2593643 RepID=UPI0034435096